MSDRGVAVSHVGLVTSVGLDAPSTCAAIRAQMRNPSPSRFVDRNAEPILAHQVPIHSPIDGVRRLAHLLAKAIEQVTAHAPNVDWSSVPMSICLSEQQRPFRTPELEEQISTLLAERLDTGFARSRSVFPYGRVSVALAMEDARKRINRSNPRVLICAADSLIEWPLLGRLYDDGRLLNSTNSNGYMPGEGAGAILVSGRDDDASLFCESTGRGYESAHFGTGLPNRAKGATEAIRMALTGADVGLSDVDYRITGLSGEHFFFREEAIAIARAAVTTSNLAKVWHPAECTGEVGALAGITCIAIAEAAARKAYAPGRYCLLNLANDDGHRSSLVLRGVAA